MKSRSVSMFLLDNYNSRLMTKDTIIKASIYLIRQKMREEPNGQMGRIEVHFSWEDYKPQDIF